MHRSETEDLVRCASCGAEVSRSSGRCYAFGAEGTLCYGCAVERGGAYDEEYDRWTTPPRTRDLGANDV